MLTKRDIKDKKIELCGRVYVASVQLWSGQVIAAGRHAALKAAQLALARFPDDVFEGHNDPAKSYSDAVDFAKIEAKRAKKFVKTLNPVKKRPAPYERLFERRCRRENS